MKFVVESRPSSQWKGDILVIPFFDERLKLPTKGSILPKSLQENITSLLKKEKFKGEIGETRLFSTHEKIKFDYVMVLGVGTSKKLDLEALRRASARLVQAANRLKGKKIFSLLSLVDDIKISPLQLGECLSEGGILGLYSFDRYKSKKEKEGKIQEIRHLLPHSNKAGAFQKGLKRGEQIAMAVSYARDLINIPSRDKPPEFLGKEAQKVRGVRTKVFNHRQIQKMGMGALYGVGQGSSNPPVFVEMHYRPPGKIKKRFAIVGKGIVFDSGGLSLKPAKSMETMKDDMAGAACVLGVMRLLPLLKMPVEVYGYFASAENMPDGSAQRPGDVVKAYNGKTIEVLNTDAEGRLALADALSYVTKHRKVDYVIDIATLTGAALVALGELYSAVMGTDAGLIEDLKRAGSVCGENIWELPLPEEYAEEIKSSVADIQNIGGMWGGSINGGLFLKNFVDEKAKWVHLDIAGPSWANKPLPYTPKGGTGVMVRTLIKLFEGV
jgi:leucyl aminopeptidase